MSEMDKFVLQYTVEMKEAINRLEQLNAKVDKTGKSTAFGTKQFKEFGKEAADEIGKLVPGIDKVSGAVNVMTASFVGAAAAIALLAVGVKSVMAMREQFGQQRIAGMDNGVSSIRMEEYQRKFVKAPGGNVNRAMAQEEIGKFSEKLKAAYADPTRMGTEFRQLQMLGVDPGKRGQTPTGLNQALTTLGTTFSKLKPEQVQGFAKTIGMNQDFALALQHLGPSIGTVTEQTEAEIKKRAQAEDSLSKFNTELAALQEAFNNLEISLGVKLLPAFTELIKLIDKIVNMIPKAAAPVGNVVQETKAKMGNKDSSFWEKYDPRIALASVLKDKAKQLFGPRDRPGESSVSSGKIIRDSKGVVVASPSSTSPTSQGSITMEKKTKDKLLDDLDERNREGAKNSAGMQLAINMFAGAVATFANAIDERQAWAAWAGEVGRASNGGDGTSASPTGIEPPAGLRKYPGAPSVNPQYQPQPSTDYDKYFAAEAKAHSGVKGMSADLLKNIARVESTMNPNAIGPMTKYGQASGLMQVMTTSATPGANLLDPKTNIKEGAQILADFLKRSNGDVRQALTMYHGGTDPKNWGPLTRAYPDKVMGPQTQAERDSGSEANRHTEERRANTSKGESRASIQLRAVQQSIAQRLGVPVNQISQGGVSRGDVDWAAAQMKAGVTNNILGIKKELSMVGMPQSQRSKLMTDLRDQESGLRMLKTYSSQVSEKAMPGERTITVGERAIIINVMDAADPNKIGSIIEGHLQGSMGEILNNAVDGVDY